MNLLWYDAARVAEPDGVIRTTVKRATDLRVFDERALAARSMATLIWSGSIGLLRYSSITRREATLSVFFHSGHGDASSGHYPRPSLSSHSRRTKTNLQWGGLGDR
jgi:hypothetical protein